MESRWNHDGARHKSASSTGSPRHCPTHSNKRLFGFLKHIDHGIFTSSIQHPPATRKIQHELCWVSCPGSENHLHSHRVHDDEPVIVVTSLLVPAGPVRAVAGRTGAVRRFIFSFSENELCWIQTADFKYRFISSVSAIIFQLSSLEFRVERQCPHNSPSDASVQYVARFSNFSYKNFVEFNLLISNIVFF